jgi:hypothetical protein
LHVHIHAAGCIFIASCIAVMPVGVWKVGDTWHIPRYAEDTEDILLDMLGSVLCKNLKIFTSRRKTRGLQPQAS